MNFTNNDMAVVISMSIAVIGLSFVMPAIGLSGGEASEPPTFNMTADRFDFAGEFPDNPGTPATGTLTWNETAEYNDNQVWLSDDVASLTIHTLENQPTVYFAIWNGSTVEADTTKAQNTEGWARIDLQDWEIDVRYYDIEAVNATAGKYNFKLDYEVNQRPDSETGFLAKIPVTLGWIGSVIWWGVTWVFTVSTNLLGMLYDVAVYSVGILSWIGTTYASVVAGANGWATIVLSIPSILLGLELGKIIMILLSLMPTT